MKIIVSGEPIRYPLTGIGRYTFELIKYLKNNKECDIKIHSGSKIVDNLSEVNNVEISSSILKDKLKHYRILRLPYEHMKLWRNNKIINSFPSYLYHGTDYALPKFAGKSVSTIHDLSVFKWAHCHPKDRAHYMQLRIREALDRATIIITDAQYNKNEIVNTFSYDPKKIKVVPLAAGGEFHQRSKSEVNSFLLKQGLKYHGYSLFVGTIEPRKNINLLLDVYSQLPENIKKHYPLVIVGHKGWSSKNIHEKIKMATQKGLVKYFGYVDNEDLPLFYSGAKLFIYPSLYEGFGLPVLEAMSSGVPTVCSTSTSLPEVAGEAAMMFNTEDSTEFKDTILQGLEDEKWQKEAKEDGLQQASKFSWQKCASETLQVYKDAINLN